MIERKITNEINQLKADYPVITIMGPRQSGKTTLAQYCFPQKPYVNLELPDIREFALKDPRRFLAQYPDGAVLGEIQNTPELLSYVQVIVDEAKNPGMFVLTGSHQMELHQAVSQSLAGRTVILNLLPLSLSELENTKINYSVDDYLLHGFYPRIYHDNLNPTKAYRAYYQTYIERDLRQLINVRDLSQFQRFIKLCAGRIGQLLNIESLSNDVGASAKTIQHWLSILEASFIIFRLQPYFNNFGKRLIKSPKLYFTDVGLAAYLLGIGNTDQINRDPLRGNLFENLVILELMKHRLNHGLDPQLYFYRDSNGNEVDVIFKSASQLIPVKIKSAETFRGDLLKPIRKFESIAKEFIDKSFLIYAGEHEQQVGDVQILNYKNAIKALGE